jgi:transcriptional regulator with XRE-family HTH domain
VSHKLKFVGLNIKKFRKQKHWTQEETAKKAGISRIALIHIENSKAIPTLETVLSLSKELDIPLEKILEAEHATPQKEETGLIEKEIGELTEQLRKQHPARILTIRKVIETLLASFNDKDEEKDYTSNSYSVHKPQE